MAPSTERHRPLPPRCSSEVYAGERARCQQHVTKPLGGHSARFSHLGIELARPYDVYAISGVADLVVDGDDDRLVLGFFRSFAAWVRGRRS